jgi:hypothetical protein
MHLSQPSAPGSTTRSTAQSLPQGIPAGHLERRAIESNTTCAGSAGPCCPTHLASVDQKVKVALMNSSITRTSSSTEWCRVVRCSTRRAVSSGLHTVARAQMEPRFWWGQGQGRRQALLISLHYFDWQQGCRGGSLSFSMRCRHFYENQGAHQSVNMAYDPEPKLGCKKTRCCRGSSQHYWVHSMKVAGLLGGCEAKGQIRMQSSSL